MAEAQAFSLIYSDCVPAHSRPIYPAFSRYRSIFLPLFLSPTPTPDTYILFQGTNIMLLVDI